MQSLLLWFSLFGAVVEQPDTLVVCAPDLRPALSTWTAHRHAQGHRLLVVSPPADSAALQALIQNIATRAPLKYLVLIGDTPRCTDPLPPAKSPEVPTNYVQAKVNVRWGSEPLIASDMPYADTNGDGTPDLAVGRIPADDIDELAAFLRKVLQYESTEHTDWDDHLHVVAGKGGFGALTDALIEAAGRQVFQQAVPAHYRLRYTAAWQLASPNAGLDAEPCELALRQLNQGSLAWIYLGHGLHTELDHVATRHGRRPLLSVDDLSNLNCGCRTPLAALIACYTGALDAPRDCLGEELALAENGPIAVFAATRVTMPYGNTVLGYELLRACFDERQERLGDILLAAQKASLNNATKDPLRNSLDALCGGISPPPVDLAAERREHVLMYHLLGDPLVRLQLPDDIAAAPDGIGALGQ